MWELASRASPTRSLRDAAMPFLEDLHAVVGHHAELAVLDGGDVLFLERLSARDAVINYSRIAGRLPLHISSSGHVLMAYGPSELLARVLAGRSSATRRGRSRRPTGSAPRSTTCAGRGTRCWPATSTTTRPGSRCRSATASATSSPPCRSSCRTTTGPSPPCRRCWPPRGASVARCRTREAFPSHGKAVSARRVTAVTLASPEFRPGGVQLMTSIVRNQWYVAALRPRDRPRACSAGRSAASRSCSGAPRPAQVDGDERPVRAPPVPALAVAQPSGRRHRRLRLPRLHLRRGRRLRRRPGADPHPAHRPGEEPTRSSSRTPSSGSASATRTAPTPTRIPRAPWLDQPGWTTVCGHGAARRPVRACWSTTSWTSRTRRTCTAATSARRRSPRRRSPPRSTRSAGIVYVSRHMADAECPPFYARSTGIRAGSPAGRTSSITPPCLYLLHSRIAPVGVLPDDGRQRPGRLPRRGRLRDHPGDRAHHARLLGGRPRLRPRRRGGVGLPAREQPHRRAAGRRRAQRAGAGASPASPTATRSCASTSTPAVWPPGGSSPGSRPRPPATADRPVPATPMTAPREVLAGDRVLRVDWLPGSDRLRGPLPLRRRGRGRGPGRAVGVAARPPRPPAGGVRPPEPPALPPPPAHLVTDPRR